MTVLYIPTTADPHSVQRTDIDGREYVLGFDWSVRESIWYLSVFDSEENPLATGIKLICNWPLLYRLPNPLLPPGHLIVFTNAVSDTTPPNLEDLAEGGRCELTYITRDDPILLL